MTAEDELPAASPGRTEAARTLTQSSSRPKGHAKTEGRRLKEKAFVAEIKRGPRHFEATSPAGRAGFERPNPRRSAHQPSLKSVRCGPPPRWCVRASGWSNRLLRPARARHAGQGCTPGRNRRDHRHRHGRRDVHPSSQSVIRLGRTTAANRHGTGPVALCHRRASRGVTCRQRGSKIAARAIRSAEVGGASWTYLVFSPRDRPRAGEFCRTLAVYAGRRFKASRAAS